MKQFYLVGKNIKNSLSPKIHSIIFKHLKVNAAYALFEPDARKICMPKDFDGINVTYPFKQEVLKLLDFNHSKCDSVNTVKKHLNKSEIGYSLHGYSTDGDGFLLDAKRLNLNIDNVLIIGAGGAAKSIAHSIKGQNGKITVLARSRPKAMEFAKQINDGGFKNCTFINQKQNIISLQQSLNLINLKNFSLTINCTPLPLDLLGHKAYYDINYICGHGIGMLIYQAILADNIFFDTNIDLDIFDTVLKGLGND